MYSVLYYYNLAHHNPPVHPSLHLSSSLLYLYIWSHISSARIKDVSILVMLVEAQPQPW
jgi:hypothetical protein